MTSITLGWGRARCPTAFRGLQAGELVAPRLICKEPRTDAKAVDCRRTCFTECKPGVCIFPNELGKTHHQGKPKERDLQTSRKRPLNNQTWTPLNDLEWPLISSIVPFSCCIFKRFFCSCRGFFLEVEQAYLACAKGAPHVGGPASMDLSHMDPQNRLGEVSFCCVRSTTSV